MSTIRFAAAALISIAVALPANAQLTDGYDRGSLETHDDSTTSFIARLTAYRELVAKKTTEDGGRLTPADKGMLYKRLRWLTNEEHERKNPFWPDAISERETSSFPDATIGR